jgi:hypothetical protein
MSILIGNKFGGVITTFTVLIGLNFGFAQTDSHEVITLSRKKFDWLINRQADSLTWLLDENVMYIHSNGWVQTKREVLEDMHSGKLVYKRVDIKEDQVRLYKNAALVTGTGRFSGINGENEFDLNLVYTEVYIRKKRKQWVLVSRHANRLL